MPAPEIHSAVAVPARAERLRADEARERHDDAQDDAHRWSDEPAAGIEYWKKRRPPTRAPPRRPPRRADAGSSVPVDLVRGAGGGGACAVASGGGEVGARRVVTSARGAGGGGRRNRRDARASRGGSGACATRACRESPGPRVASAGRSASPIDRTRRSKRETESSRDVSRRPRRSMFFSFTSARCQIGPAITHAKISRTRRNKPFSTARPPSLHRRSPRSCPARARRKHNAPRLRGSRRISIETGEPSGWYTSMTMRALSVAVAALSLVASARAAESGNVLRFAWPLVARHRSS